MFIAANPGLGQDGMAIQCRAGQLTEVRVCLNKDDLGFRRCLDVDDGGCRASSILVATEKANPAALPRRGSRLRRLSQRF